MCAKYSWELVLYTPEQLNTVELDHPSEVVFRATGLTVSVNLLRCCLQVRIRFCSLSSRAVMSPLL